LYKQQLLQGRKIIHATALRENGNAAMKTYECAICGWIYDEAKGCPEEGIPAGTRWEDVPADWSCPVCGAAKSDFHMVDIEPEATPTTPAEPTAARRDAGPAPLTILGTGLAGYTLAREIRKIDGTTPLRLITRDGGGFYTKPSLSNALANHKTPAQLQTKTAEQMAAELNADIRPRTEVSGIDADLRRLHLADNTELAYDRLVIAWGADPIRVPMDGDAANDVQSVNDLDDFSRFHESLDKARSVAVIGAGLIGCEFANDLASRQIKSFVIDPAGWPLSRLLPEPAGQHFASALQKEGIEFHFGVSAKAVWNTSNGYRIVLSDGKEIVVDRLLSAIGLRPRTSLAQAAGIACQRGIVTDRLLETSIPGIYASGDCAEIAGLNLPFILPIMHQATALARTLTGTPTPLRYPAMPVVVKTPACPTVVCPPPAGTEGTWTCEPVSGGLQALYRAPDGRLAGFALLGSATARTQELAASLPDTLS